MEELLTIKNFGPVLDASITVKNLTVFIGPPATGKSTATQLLYFFRRIEDLLPPYHLPPQEATLTVLTRWLGSDLSIYAQPGSLLHWTPPWDAKNPGKHTLQWSQQGIQLSDALEERIQNVLEEKPLHTPAHIYIPASRILFSFLPPYYLPTFLEYQSSTYQWPGYIHRFYNVLGRTLGWLSAKELDQRSPNSQISQDLTFIQPKIDALMKGQIHFSTDAVQLEIAHKALHATSMAAGQMEVWPFWAIIKAGLLSKRLEFAQIYYEEPEAHLHPQAQFHIMEIITYLVNHNTRFLITTHSPYILYAINNALMAHKVIEAGKSLPPGTPAETALHPDQVAAYRFAHEGTVHNIMDSEVGLIDADELDAVADELDATFTDLQDQLER